MSSKQLISLSKTFPLRQQLNLFSLAQRQRGSTQRIQLQQVQISRHQSTSKSTFQQPSVKNDQTAPSQNQESKEEYNYGYEEVRSNEVNPHAYFYRYLAVPFLKVGVITAVTYFGLDLLWNYLEKDIYPENKKKSDETASTS